jgi:hypothetical protein
MNAAFPPGVPNKPTGLSTAAVDIEQLLFA